jgi:peptide/nickel transport system substrate-binding protein
VRKALSVGINREAIIQNAYNGIGKPAYGFTDNLVWAYTEQSGDSQKEEAIAILEEAGWVLGNDGIRIKDGVRCEFDVFATDTSRFLLASAVAADAAELGIKINPLTTSWGEMGNSRFSTPVMWGWGQFDPMVLNSLLYSELFLTSSWSNVVGFANPQTDGFIDAAIGASSEDEAIRNWKEAQRVANDHYPYLYIVNIEHCYFVSDRLDISLATQIPHPHGHGSPIICNMKDWKLK